MAVLSSVPHNVATNRAFRVRGTDKAQHNRLHDRVYGKRKKVANVYKICVDFLVLDTMQKINTVKYAPIDVSQSIAGTHMDSSTQATEHAPATAK